MKMENRKKVFKNKRQNFLIEIMKYKNNCN